MIGLGNLFNCLWLNITANLTVKKQFVKSLIYNRFSIKINQAKSFGLSGEAVT